MKIRILGTGDAFGIPAIGCSCEICSAARKGIEPKRLRSSIAVYDEDYFILVDASPDVQVQLQDIAEFPDAVLLTHVHRDHVAGLPDIAKEYLKNRIPVYGNEFTIDYVRKWISGLLLTSEPGFHKYLDWKIVNGPFGIGDIRIKPVELKHYVPTIGYIIEGSSTFAYLTDTGPEAEVFTDGNLDDVEVIFLDCSWAKSRGFFHMSIKDIKNLPKKLHGKIICIHIGHENLPYHDLKKELQDVAHVPLDNQIINF